MTTVSCYAQKCRLLTYLAVEAQQSLRSRSSAEIERPAACTMDKISTFEDISVLVFKEGDRSLQVPTAFTSLKCARMPRAPELFYSRVKPQTDSSAFVSFARFISRNKGAGAASRCLSQGAYVLRKSRLKTGAGRLSNENQIPFDATSSNALDNCHICFRAS